MGVLLSFDIDHALQKITHLHTLGPSGTNCERAAKEWFARREMIGNVVLHSTLESTIDVMPFDGSAALLGCVVYPDLHTLVFGNLERMVLADVFITPTFNMVLAARDPRALATVSSHPAPQHLVPGSATTALTSSNSQAALDCAAGRTDGCITTLPAAQRNGLTVVHDFGPVPMGFTIHIPTPVGVGA